MDMRVASRTERGGVCSVGKGCDLEEKAGIREARERERLGGRSCPWAERHLSLMESQEQRKGG